MPAAPLPDDEKERLAALLGCHILDTPAEQRFDDLTLLASQVTDAPIALISLIDKDRQWFKSRIGIDLHETPREQAFCAHAILTPDRLLIANDAQQDPRFRDNPLVTGGPGIRFYAGAPLVDEQGKALGTLCVIDTVPRELDARQTEALAALARQVMAQIRLTGLIHRLQIQTEAQERSQQRMAEYRDRLEQTIEQLEHLSTTDSLTGVSNRRAFNEQLQQEFDRSLRYASELSLVMLDIDHFKKINDAHGHPVGDRVLEAFGQLLRNDRRASDTLARYGGEEFALILPNTPAREASALGERLRRRIEQHDWPCGKLTSSVGVTSRRGGDTLQTLLTRADKALYAAKNAGRNCVISR